MPVTVICRYVARPGQEAKVEALLAEHWPTLRRLSLATEQPARRYRGLPDERDAAGALTYVEIFEWVDESAMEVAHQTPEVLELWEPLGEACESLEFPHFEAL